MAARTRPTSGHPVKCRKNWCNQCSWDDFTCQRVVRVSCSFWGQVPRFQMLHSEVEREWGIGEALTPSNLEVVRKATFRHDSGKVFLQPHVGDQNAQRPVAVSASSNQSQIDPEHSCIDPLKVAQSGIARGANHPHGVNDPGTAVLGDVVSARKFTCRFSGSGETVERAVRANRTPTCELRCPRV